MKGDFYFDFSIAVFLFVLTISSLFIIVNSEVKMKKEYELSELAKIKIKIPSGSFEKRIIILNGEPHNEFVNLSGYDIDLIVDDEGYSVCFDDNLKGFIANKKIYYLYSTPNQINRKLCTIDLYNNSLSEFISGPVYLNITYGKQKDIWDGAHCEIIPYVYIYDGIQIDRVTVCT
ncbi:MAG: hypothetical protein B6U88_01050 [Candidatus Aenigmarchaeota archaeon ex4484_56]|nr:MAG: hypothetical protein B6U88_01050 [Candidatus Aenigmarchaeota archaeon ex4484_56]